MWHLEGLKAMDQALLGGLFLAAVWMQLGCIADGHGRRGSITHLPMKDVLLLKDEADPKCFSRTEYDLTCFFETPDNKTYDFFYKTDDGEKRCDLRLQRAEDGSVLHVCLFPPDDTYLFVLTHLRVTEAGTNRTLYTRSVSVEDQVLLDPPTNMSHCHTGLPGQLQLTWQVDKAWESKVHYGIRYSSNRLGEKNKEGDRDQLETLTSLVPGEVLQFQIRINVIKYGLDETRGHWSHWSEPVAAMVPQSAVDISLECYTSDLHNVTCQWDENIYKDVTHKLFYRHSPSKSLGWTECLKSCNRSDRCRFHGDETQLFRVKLGASGSPAPLGRTFYSDAFYLNGSIKTAPPGQLEGRIDSGTLCLSWAAPLPALSAHLLYQVHYHTREGGPWLTVSSKGPETRTCLEGLTGSQYSVQVRAKPNGTYFSGQWSDWSLKLSGSTPPDMGAILISGIPLLMLVLAIVLISLISRYLSKFKKLLWPPIPNLDKVLQGFLAEINGQTWDPPFASKQCLEENLASVVEIMYPEDAAAGLEKPPNENAPLVIPEGWLSVGEQGDRSSEGTLEVSPDYVTLSTMDAAPSRQQRNEYIYEHVAECRGLARGPRVGCVQPAASTPERSSTRASCPSGMDILNRSYLLPAEGSRGLEPGPAAAPGGSDKRYTNMDALTYPDAVA
ncbi:unnamed protein product [Gadus morhua 'NCC']